MAITLLDVIFLGVALISGLLAMIRGFSREVLSIVSWIVAAIVAFTFYEQLAPIVLNYVDNETIALVISGAAIFLVTLVVVTLITTRIADFIIDSSIGPLDRTLGFLFGLARGALLMVVAMLFFDWLQFNNNEPPAWIAEAKSRPLLQDWGQDLIDILPEDPEQALRDLTGGDTEAEPGTEL